MVFKKDLTPLSKKGAIHKHTGKGASERPMLPSRSALNSVVTGRSMNDYAKATPGPESGSPDIFDMGE